MKENSKDRYSITELAKIANVTRQCIYNKLNSLGTELKEHLIKINNVKYLSKEGAIIVCKNLKPDINLDIFNVVDNNVKSDSKNIETTLQQQLIDSYIKQIEILTNELNYVKQESIEKNIQLNTKDKLLENMQVLLKDQKLLLESKEKKLWWQFWKS